MQGLFICEIKPEQTGRLLQPVPLDYQFSGTLVAYFWAIGRFRLRI